MNNFAEMQPLHKDATIKQKDNDRTKTQPGTNAAATKQSSTDKQNHKHYKANVLVLWRIAHVLGSRRWKLEEL